MKRTALALTLIIVIAILVIASYFLPQTNTTIPQTNKAEAKITAFTADLSWHGAVVGVTIDMTFNVTVQNVGTIEVNGANITVERISADNDSSICSHYTEELSVLHPGETRQIGAYIFTDVNHFGEVTTSNFLAILSVNGTVLDERRLF
jgi:hypothetical protein